MKAFILFVLIFVTAHLEVFAQSLERNCPNDDRYSSHKCICSDTENQNGLCEHQQRDGPGPYRDGRGHGRQRHHNCLSEEERKENRQILQNTETEKIDFGEFESFDGADGNDSTTNIIAIPTDSINVVDSFAIPRGQANDFGEFMPLEESNLIQGDGVTHQRKAETGNFKWIIIALIATILAGILVKFKPTRKFRRAFLIVSVILFGFYLGGCPCPISSMHNVVLAGIGVDKPWQSMVWFLGLLPITYLFGKTWCGWVCHLGGLQEILYRPGKWEALKTEKAQMIFRWIRIFLFVALVIQIIVTRTNLFKEIDPFKGAFNLFPTNVTMWVLLIFLLMSSVFIFRPFCRTVCPVGLLLGWIGKIPGASILDNSGTCNACVVCHKNCEIGAITREKGYSELNNEECIRCGECLDSCKRQGLKFFKKSREHRLIVECKKVA